MLAEALEAEAVGICVLPPKQDGSKAPLLHWKEYQNRRATTDEIHRWYGDGRRTGLGVVLGAISGNLEVLEFDDLTTYSRFKVLAQPAGLGEVVDAIEAGYLEHSPNGIHWLYRCEEIGTNTKLARRPKAPDEMDDANDKVKVLIETRGEGGFAIVAPTYGNVHPTGRSYDRKAGGWHSIATITANERAALFDLARSLDAMPRREQRSAVAMAQPRGDDERPGDWYNRTETWAGVLEPHGWTFVFEHRGEGYWRRPGKEHGQSATTNYAGSDLLKVFSSSTLFDTETAYTKFAAFAVLNYGGDFSVAASYLAQLMPERPRVTHHDEAPPPREPPPEDDYEASDWVPPEEDKPSADPPLEDEPKAPGGFDPAVLAAVAELGLSGDARFAMVVEVTGRIRTEQATGIARRLVRDDRLVAEADLDGVVPMDVAALLAMPRPPRVPVFGDLVAEGHNATVVARWKVGKSTLVDNMAMAAVTGGLFLARFPVPEPLRVVLLNFELDEQDMADRLEVMGIGPEASARLAVVNLRGRRLPITTEAGRRVLARWLADHGAQVVIVDPFGAAFAAAGGESENDNAEVRRFLICLDEVKREAGCRTLIMPVHTGRGIADEGEEQGRGASVLEDWPDVRILLTKDKNEARFIRTEGRAWDLHESRLGFDPHTRRLMLAGSDMGINRAAARREQAAEKLAEALREQPGQTTRDVRDLVSAAGVGRNADKDSVVVDAITKRLIHTHPGVGVAVLHYAGPSHSNHDCPEGWTP